MTVQLTRPRRPLPLFRLALALSLGAAVSLGITRFAYALLLPAMRTDLGWSYTLAGAMNTANALGYLLGALVTPRLMRRLAPTALLLGGSMLASVFMALSGLSADAGFLLLQRLLAGLASAFVFNCRRPAGGAAGGPETVSRRSVAGPVLRRHRPGHCGVSAGGARRAASRRRPGARLGLGLVGAGRGLRARHAVLAWPARVLQRLPAGPRRRRHPAQQPGPSQRTFAWRDFGWGLAGYFSFGMGYIGYMTFVIALLARSREPARHR